MNKLSINLLIIFYLNITIGINTAFAMGNGTQNNADENVEYHCSPNTKQSGAAAKRPNQNQSYTCAILTAPETLKTQGATAAKSPQRENHTTQKTDSYH